jgi:iron complex outermembrane recepter protein
MMTKETLGRHALAGFVAAVGLSVPAWVAAQTAPAAKVDAGGLEEVVVTARKTEESLQITPVAVTAITTAGLVEQQIAQVVDLPRATPNMAIGGAGTGPSSIVYLSIRGEAQNSPNSATDSAVGIYIDGVYIGRPIVGNQGFLDVSQVEVARGPQGTLFGRNTTGGALSVTSNQPTGKFEGHVRAGYGNYGTKQGELVVNAPIDGEELATRLAIRYGDHDAYYHNPITGIDPAKLQNDWNGRLSLRWAPTSVPLVMTLAYDHANERDTGTPTALMGVNPGGLLAALGFVQGLNPGLLTGTFTPTQYLSTDANWSQSFGSPHVPYDPEMNVSFNSNRASGVSLNTDLDVGAAHVKLITGWRESDTADSEDLDGSPIDGVSFISEYIQHQFSQELQVSGKIDKFDLIGGAYFFTEGGSERSDANQLPGLPLLLGGTARNNTVGRDFADFTSFSHAAFLQTNYHFTDTIRGTVGYRYTWDTRQLIRHGVNDALSADPICSVGSSTGKPLSAAVCVEPHEAQFSYPAFTAGLDWQATDRLFLYVKTSKASMAGGFNTRPVGANVSNSFQPESNQDIELGLKADVIPRVLRTNLALFGADQDQVQRIVNAFDPVNQRVTQYVTNSGQSRTYGAELEVTLLPWKGMDISADAAYLHAAYKAGTFKEVQFANGASGATVTVDRSGEPVPQAPKETFGASATQTVPLSFGKASIHVDYSYRASVVYTYDTPSSTFPPATFAAYSTANALGAIPSYSLVNARLALNLDSPNLEIAIWGRNLADKHYFTQQFDSYAALGYSMNFKGDPRTYGLQATWNF